MKAVTTEILRMETDATADDNLKLEPVLMFVPMVIVMNNAQNTPVEMVTTVEIMSRATTAITKMETDAVHLAE